MHYICVIYIGRYIPLQLDYRHFSSKSIDTSSMGNCLLRIDSDDDDVHVS